MEMLHQGWIVTRPLQGAGLCPCNQLPLLLGGGCGEMTLGDHLRGMFSPTIWSVANFCLFLTTVTATGRQGNREEPGDLCPPKSPEKPEQPVWSPPWPLTHLGLDDGAVQGAVPLVIEKAELQGTQGGWRGQRQEPREHSLSHSTNIARALITCPVWAKHRAYRERKAPSPRPAGEHGMGRGQLAFHQLWPLMCGSPSAYWPRKLGQVPEPPEPLSSYL